MINPTPLQLMPSKRNFRLPRHFGLNAAPPHALIESKSRYSIVFNMLGISRKGIGIDVNVEKREITVLARKDRENIKNGYFWVFGVPMDALMSEMTARHKNGALEIVIPKYSFTAHAGLSACLALGA